MGNRSSAKCEEDEIEDEQDTEDEESEEEDTSMFEERSEEEKLAAEAAWEAKLRAKPTGTVAAPKKKATAAVDFAALAAAKAKKAAAAKKAPVTKAPSTAPQDQDDSNAKPAVPAGDGDLPQGEEGAEWEALADGLIRQERDVKSVKRGAVQNGERVTQTGPWRADPTGRVRMPVRGPRGVFGWVSLDERRCQNAMGEYGAQLFEFISKQAAAPEVVPASAPPPPTSPAKAKAKVTAKTGGKAVTAAAPAARADELADLLDEWGISDDDVPDSGSDNDEGNEEPGAGPVDNDEPEVVQIPLPSAAAPKAGSKPSAKAAGKNGAAAPEASQLTDSEKALRALKKKLRELDDLEARGNLTEAQQQKLAVRQELREKEVSLVSEIKRENRKAKEAAKIEAGGVVRKRPKTKKGAAKAADTKSSGGTGALVVVAVVVAVAACAVALALSQ